MPEKQKQPPPSARDELPPPVIIKPPWWSDLLPDPPEGVDPIPSDELYQKYVDDTLSAGNCIVRLNQLTFDQLKVDGYVMVNEDRQFIFNERIPYGEFQTQAI